MIDASSALKTAYWAFLQVLTYGDKKVEIFSGMAPGKAVAPYVIIGPWSPRSDNTKDSFGQKGEITLQVVDRMPDALYSEVRANAIADTITTLLKPEPTSEPLVLAGFAHFSVIGDTLELTQPNSTDTVYRKIISITHTVSELPNSDSG